MEEEELEGEAVAGPSGEVTAYSSGNTPPFLSFPLLTIYMYTFFSTYHYSSLTLVFFLADESADEEDSRPRQRRRKTLTCFTVGCKWGAFLSDKKRHGGYY